MNLPPLDMICRQLCARSPCCCRSPSGSGTAQLCSRSAILLRAARNPPSARRRLKYMMGERGNIAVF